MKRTLLALGLCIGFATPVFAADAVKTSRVPAKMEKTNCGVAAHDGMGYDMSGGHGMMGEGMSGGHGMMTPGIGMLNSLDLSDDQRTRINKLSDELQHKNWATMGMMNDETNILRDLYHADKRDPSAIGNEYKKIFDLKRQMIEAMIAGQNDMEALLTDEQRAKLKELRRHARGYMMH